MSKRTLDTKEMIDSPDDFEAMYTLHAPSIYRFLFWRTKNVQLTEDLTSVVFEKAWRARDKFSGGSAKAWLYRIARNVLIDHWRRKRDLLVEDTDTLDQTAVESDVAEAFDRALTAERLKKAISKLPSDMRSVVTLRFIEGLSGRQTAAKLRLSESNVRVLQYRALRKLRSYMK